MKPYTRRIFGLLMVCSVFALAPAALRAEVTRVEITSRQDVLNGKSFGTVGAYEKLGGKVYFAVDPNNPHNKIIADVDKAPRNSQGKVEFSADLFIIQPKDPSRGNGVALLEVVNRGNKGLLGVFNRAKGSSDPTAEADFGDGLLMREGYTLVAVGWEFEVRKDRDKNLIGLMAPIATENGKPITGWISPWFIPDKTSDSFEYTSQYNTGSYPPLDPKNPAYRLTVREGWVAMQHLVPREDWQFGRTANGQVVFDPNWLTVKGGFKAGETYQLTYESKDPPVAGLGFAAIRDMASTMKNDSAAIVHARYVYTYGASQVGRYQRQMVYEGFTTDEKGRQAIDALMIHTGGTSFGSFNKRFALPNELGSFTETVFPIRYEVTTDPVTGKRDGLGARIPAGQDPKIFFVDTGSEYWDRGRVAALRHLTIDGLEDLPDPPNVRIFTLAGTKHGPGTWPPADSDAQPLKVNPNDYRWAQRALLEALDQWVRKGVEPPPSRHPQLSDGTLVAQSDIKFPSVPGVQWPYHVPGGFRADLQGAFSVLPFIVPRVDSDGNDLGGIRLPEQAVPLGTYTDWAFRSEQTGAPNTLIAMAGSYIPFAKTRADREKSQDPRLSVEERYGNRAEYVRRVEAAAKELVNERYLLQEDVAPIVTAAGQHWDWTMTTTGVNQSRR
ncbi:MAG TPA: alpha/beta hydrolase domain-containing protein [Candidatus Acidoferrales bacterium]|nr:alpha/beta hydrolase domain-containing protein [Candidatus Acidoferrales bacterium]